MIKNLLSVGISLPLIWRPRTLAASMDKFWKAALTVAGIGAVAFFVFYSLYRQWLTLPIFPQLTQSQAFTVMLVFLVLTFLALIAGVVAWLMKK